MNTPFVCPSEEYVMIHKSACVKLANEMPVGEKENVGYSERGSIMEVLEVHRIAKEWKGENNAT